MASSRARKETLRQLRTASRFISLCLRPFSTSINFWDYLQNVLILGIIIGLVPLNLVDQKHVTLIADHVPGGRASFSVGVLLLLVTIVALRLVNEQIKREDWDGISRGLYERIVRGMELENTYPLDNPEELKGLTQLQGTEKTLYWLADVINWAMECEEEIGRHWGFSEASQFRLRALPLTPLPPESSLAHPKLTIGLLRRAVIERREHLERLQKEIARRVSPQ